MLLEELFVSNQRAKLFSRVTMQQLVDVDPPHLATCPLCLRATFSSPNLNST